MNVEPAVNRGRPLRGATIVSTRQITQSKAAVEAIERLGGKALIMPLIEVVTRYDPEVIQRAQTLSRYDALIVTSANGIRTFADVSAAASIPFADAAPTCYAIGQATAEAVRKQGGRVESFPDVTDGVEFAVHLVEAFQVGSKKRILCLQGKLADQQLAVALRNAGHTVDVCICYDTRPVDVNWAEWQPVLGSPNTFVLLFSPSAAKALVSQAGNEVVSAECLASFVCIGRSTANACKRLGLEVAGVAARPTTESLLQTVVQIVQARSCPPVD